jgi:hypothetical protein
MSKILKYEHNIETDETKSHELNAAEMVQWQAAVDATEASQIALQEKEVKKAALYKKLGISADEAKLLLS